ncbi:CPBP family intramembrane metalloprotease [Staphylococcus condimenti]|uniref:CPBP family intramembrane metalloprotease n=1 Tax=Staphylococcus condimenti TaxID=70255 RepID=A0A4Q7CRI6_9STAP|nr:type II CAAX endopeptidase family protein [Staphylococcus condimenti]RZI03369.1 CPBP family intramembrane metalloprotease [Staphylococcus condimenti]RZI04062.1 CPBP family intramembrane metalloprotease [Staphylococcus condimenti]
MNYELNESMKQTQKESYRKKPSLWGATFICIGLFIGAPIVLGLLIALFVLPFVIITHRFNGELFFSNDTMFIASMLAFPILLFLILLINKKHYHKTYESLGFYLSEWKKKYVIGAGLGVSAIVIVYLCNLIFQAVSININPNFNLWILIAVLIGYMIQGMTEEVFFRGFIMNIFSSQKGVVFGIIMSSVFFAIMHIGNPGTQFLAIINIFIFGLVFGLLFYWSNNIWLTGAAHSFWNFTMGSVLGIPVSGQRDITSIFKTNVFNDKWFINGGAFGLEGGIIVTIFGIILCIVLWKLCQKKGLITKN